MEIHAVYGHLHAHHVHRGVHLCEIHDARQDFDQTVLYRGKLKNTYGKNRTQSQTRPPRQQSLQNQRPTNGSHAQLQ